MCVRPSQRCCLESGSSNFVHGRTYLQGLSISLGEYQLSSLLLCELQCGSISHWYIALVYVCINIPHHSHRKLELKSLNARKYLDAACVYFWATTPIIISIVTFVTYSLLGNQLTASKVIFPIAIDSLSCITNTLSYTTSLYCTFPLDSVVCLFVVVPSGVYKSVSV